MFIKSHPPFCGGGGHTMRKQNELTEKSHEMCQLNSI